MRIIAILAVLITSNFIYSQSRFKSCEEGTNDATTHFKAKKYSLSTLGQIYFPEFQDFQIKIAKEKYGITLTHVECVQFPYNSCYRKTMRELVLKKFGHNIEDKINREALVAFKKSKKYIEEIKPKIDTGFVFNAPHTRAEFPKEKGKLKEFLLDNTQELKNQKHWSALAEVIIEKDGTITFLKFYKTLHEDVETEVKRLLTLIPKWIPAEVYGEKVRSKRTVSFSCRYDIELMDRINKEKHKKQ